MTKRVKNTIKFCVILLVICAPLLLPTKVEGINLYLESSRPEYNINDIFIIDMRINTEGECINTVKGDLSFDNQVLEVVDFSRGDSIFSIWLASPELNQEQGVVSFAGGTPGGYCGQVPGDPGESNLLGRVILQVSDINMEEQINTGLGFLESTQLFLNDGLGTKAQFNSQELKLKIMPEKREVSLNEWLGRIRADLILPEPFEIEVHRERNVFEGKYFITFQAVDKQTGIDYYEIKEGSGPWEKGESPYLLQDQIIQDIIRVKAVDKAGNQRISEYKPEKETSLFIYLIVGFVLMAILIAWLTVRKITAEQTRKKSEFYG